MKKIILGLTMVLLLAGCDSYKYCKDRGYQGIVLEIDCPSPDLYCSNGFLDLSGEWVMTTDGLRKLERHVYIEFNKTKGNE